MLIWSSFLRERRKKRFLTSFLKLFSISLLVIYLYLLFNVRYTANPVLVLFNYLAILTSISNIILFKYYELPSLLWEIVEKGKSADFYQLSREERGKVWREGKLELEYPIDDSPESLSQLLQLKSRFSWKTWGKVYFFLYILFSFWLLYHLFSVYRDTGFQ